MARRPRVVLLDLAREWGPAERQVLWLAEALGQGAARPIIAAHPKAPLHHYARLRGIPVVAVEGDGGWAPFVARRFAASVRRETACLVHAFSAPSARLVAQALSGSGIPFVVSLHPDDQAAPSSAVSRAIRQAAAVMTPSAAARQAVLDVTGADPDRVGVVAPVVDLSEQISRPSREQLAAVGVPDGAPFVSFLGALSPSDDPISFVRAFAYARHHHPTLQALLIGEGAQREALRTMAGPLGVADAVHLPGVRDDAERLLAASAVHVASGVDVLRAEGIVRAFAAGVPVVATRVVGVDAFVTDGESGLVVPVGDATAIGAAITRLLDDETLRRQCVAGGRRRAMEFAAERASARTIAIYRAVLGLSAPSAEVDPHRARAPINPIVVGELTPSARPAPARPAPRETVEDDDIVLDPSQAIA